MVLEDSFSFAVEKVADRRVWGQAKLFSRASFSFAGAVDLYAMAAALSGSDLLDPNPTC
jgi:hypothetical protein